MSRNEGRKRRPAQANKEPSGRFLFKIEGIRKQNTSRKHKESANLKGPSEKRIKTPRSLK